MAFVQRSVVLALAKWPPHIRRARIEEVFSFASNLAQQNQNIQDGQPSSSSVLEAPKLSESPAPPSMRFVSLLYP